MPRRYGRRRNYRRRRQPRRPRYRKPMRYRVADMAYNGYRLAVKLARYVNAEEKYHDATLTGSTLDHTSGIVTTLNNPAQGDTDLTRDGDSIKITRITGSVMCFGNAGSNTISRFWIIWDPQNAVTTLAQHWETGAATSILGNKDHDLRFRSRVLYDSGPMPHVLSSSTYVRTRKINIPVFKHTQFEAGTTTINTGAIKIIAMSDQANATNEPTLRAQLRVHFIDN